MARAKGRIAVAPTQGVVVRAEAPPNYDRLPILFSLEKLQQGTHCLTALSQEHKAMFADAIFRRKNMTWGEVLRAPKHGLGSEKINIKCIKSAIPAFITEDVDTLLAIRYHGKCPMVGYRMRQTFFVIWFDPNFTLYDHG